MADCFPIVNGTPDVQLDQTVPLKNHLLFIHWFLNAAIGLSAFFLNTLLLFLIQTRSSQMSNMRPLLNASCVIDLVLSITNTMAGPFLNTSHGHFTCFWNGLFPTNNRNLVALTVSIIGWFTIGSWGCLPVQFLYRLEVVKTGSRPRGLKLAAYIFLGLFAMGTAMATAFNIYIKPTEWYRTNAVKILRNSGYQISRECVVGAHATDPKMNIYMNYFTVVMLVGYSTIVYSEVVRRRYLRHLSSQMSSATKRIHRDLNRAFLALAMCPILTSVFPSVFINYTIGSCRHFPVPMVVHSLIVVTVPLINSLTTLCFVRPYRQQIKTWLCGSRVRPSNSTIASVSYTVKGAGSANETDNDSSMNVF